jgi:GAF domain-containing protein
MNSRNASAPHAPAQRSAALSRVGAALMSEWDEAHLFQLIVETARDLIGATFAALTLRPVNEEGEPLVPSEGHLFHLAAIVGVTPKQEKQLRRMPLGGEGLLLPIFRHGVPVRVADDGPTSHGESGCGCVCPRTTDGRRVTRSRRPARTSHRPQFPWRARA